jgi:hypothetical protein
MGTGSLVVRFAVASLSARRITGHPILKRVLHHEVYEWSNNEYL